ncbi:hypothetical protein NPIL_377241 [Nephila pilipes]|uniref:Uncharacterized protein n=1 Tax=Nephila pilipes TaxID=299642 RepID=A0A8X6NJW4_NEPPI|nr:hypothetical protein NPIL_377241 [Nephila pilipes]
MELFAEIVKKSNHDTLCPYLCAPLYTRVLPFEHLQHPTGDFVFYKDYTTYPHSRIYSQYFDKKSTVMTLLPWSSRSPDRCPNEHI